MTPHTKTTTTAARTGAALCLFSLATAAFAAPVWQQSSLLDSTLDNNYGYASDAVARTATVSFTSQVATNTDSSAAHHFGMYLGWAWSYDGQGAATSLPWDNGSSSFSGGDVTMKIVGASGSLLLADVVGDTWIGVAWGPGWGESPIATDGSWNAPLFDFGVIPAGGNALYDLTLEFSFANQAAFDDWNAAGSFYLGGMGVQVVPEPEALALAAAGLLVAAFASRRRRS